MQNDRTTAPSVLVTIGAERLLWIVPQAQTANLHAAAVNINASTDGPCAAS